MLQHGRILKTLYAVKETRHKSHILYDSFHIEISRMGQFIEQEHRLMFAGAVGIGVVFNEYKVSFRVTKGFGTRYR